MNDNSESSFRGEAEEDVDEGALSEILRAELDEPCVQLSADISEVLQAVLVNSGIKSVQVSGNISDASERALVEVIKANGTLVELDFELRNNGILASLCGALLDNTNLTKIALAFTDRNVPEGPIQTLLQRTSTIKMILLDRGPTRFSDCFRLYNLSLAMRGLLNNCSVRTLQLHKSFRVEINLMCEILKTHPTLKSLSLAIYSYEDTLALADALAGNATLELLNLSFFGRFGKSLLDLLAIIVGALYGGISHVESLHMQDFGKWKHSLTLASSTARVQRSLHGCSSLRNFALLQPDGFAVNRQNQRYWQETLDAVLVSLCGKTSVQEFRLSKPLTHRDADDAQNLLAMVAQTSSVKKLVLDEYRLNQQDFDLLAQALRDNSCIDRLHLQRLGIESTMELGRTLAETIHIVSLYLEYLGNLEDTTDEIVKNLVSGLARNNSVAFLDLRNCDKSVDVVRDIDGCIANIALECDFMDKLADDELEALAIGIKKNGNVQKISGLGYGKFASQARYFASLNKAGRMSYLDAEDMSDGDWIQALNALRTAVA